MGIFCSRMFWCLRKKRKKKKIEKGEFWRKFKNSLIKWYGFRISLYLIVVMGWVFVWS